MKRNAFTLMEMIAVVIIVMMLAAITAVGFGNSRPSVQVKNDAAKMVSFLRNMWDRTKVSGAPLILNPDYENGKLSYFDPREGREFFADFSSDAAIIGIRINDRFYTRDSYVPPMNPMIDEDGNELPMEDPAFFGDEEMGDTLYISEGRGLTYVGVTFALLTGDEDNPVLEHITMATLNLITGRGTVEKLEEGELDDLMVQAEQEALDEEDN